MSRDRPFVLVLEISDLIPSQTELSPNVHKSVCPICLDFKSLVKWSEADLQHKCCQSCRNRYIAGLVAKGQWEIGCFMSGCHEKLRSERVSDELHKFQPDLAVKWESILTRRYLLGVKDVIWCPGRNCTNATIYSDIARCRSVKCRFCAKCRGQRHRWTTCVKFPTLEGVKLCPTCGVHIERIDGCPAMICTICGQKFCWTCGQLNQFHHNHNQPQPVNVPNEQNLPGGQRNGWLTKLKYNCCT